MKNSKFLRLAASPLLALVVLLALTIAIADAQSGIALTRGPYLGNQTATSVQIIWNTNSAALTRVDYGVDLTYGRTTTVPTPSTLHVVTLTNLLTGTTYFYQIASPSGGAPLAASTLKTNRDEGDSDFTFAVFGDSGVAIAPSLAPSQYNVAALLARVQPAFVLHTGDVIYNLGEYANFDSEFFRPYSRTLTSVPFFTSLGNHDYGTANGQPYLDNFYLPSNNPLNSERYYSFDYGNAHIVALDANQDTSAEGAMTLWLRNDLASTSKFWKFVFFHQPIYTSGPHSFDFDYLSRRANLAPVFDEYNVDIVFAGHDHDYERTLPIRNFAAASSGVVYITTGGGGATVYPVGKSTWTAFSQSAHHVVKVSVAGCRITMSAIQPAGEPSVTTDTQFDSTSLDRCARVFLPTLVTGGSNAVDRSATRRAQRYR